MSNKIYIISTLISLFVITYSCKTTNTREQIFYKNKLLYLNPDADLASYFYIDNGKYHESIETLMNTGKYDVEDKKFLKRQLIDIYLDNMQMLHYYPIYNDTTKMPVACILLSVGEDGVFNNVINSKLQLNNWHEKIKAYNIEQVKVEIEKITIRYPVFNSSNGQQRWYIFNINESTLSNKNLLLKGDSLFINTSKYEALDNLTNPRVPFFYPEFSMQRKFSGEKDYIVSWGCKVIDYEILK
jgi:hypothetical protein